MRDLIAIIIFLVVLWLVWFFFIRLPGKATTDGRFLKMPPPVDTGETHDRGPFRDRS